MLLIRSRTILCKKKNETHIPDDCFPIIAGAHSNPWIERVDIQDIGLPKRT